MIKIYTENNEEVSHCMEKPTNLELLLTILAGIFFVPRYTIIPLEVNNGE